MPPGPHERPPARACCSQHVHIAAVGRCEPIAPTEPGRTELFELGAPRCCVRATRVLRRQVLEPRRIRSRCLARSDNGSLWRTCSASGARWRRDRVEKCCLLRTACTVLLDELTWVLHLRVLAQERRCLLQVERPDAEDKFRACERGEEDDGRDEGGGGRGGVPQQKSRSAAACSITTDALPCRFRALPLDAVRLDVTREHRACRLSARRLLASRPALIPLPGSSRTA